MQCFRQLGLNNLRTELICHWGVLRQRVLSAAVPPNKWPEKGCGVVVFQKICLIWWFEELVLYRSNWPYYIIALCLWPLFEYLVNESCSKDFFNALPHTAPASVLSELDLCPNSDQVSASDPLDPDLPFRNWPLDWVWLLWFLPAALGLDSCLT